MATVIIPTPLRKFTNNTARLEVKAGTIQDTVDELTQLLRQHWALGGAGIVVSQPLTGEQAIPSAELAAAETATGHGPERTPAELRQLQDRLGERVIVANVALLERNAALAGSLAVALGRVTKSVEAQGG